MALLGCLELIQKDRARHTHRAPISRSEALRPRKSRLTRFSVDYPVFSPLSYERVLEIYYTPV